MYGLIWKWLASADLFFSGHNVRKMTVFGRILHMHLAHELAIAPLTSSANFPFGLASAAARDSSAFNVYARSCVCVCAFIASDVARI